jgi:hypothetical protein
MLVSRVARSSLLVATGAIVLAGQLAAAAPLHAEQEAGATYLGTLSSGGPVQFAVSADGAELVSFKAENIQCAEGDLFTVDERFAKGVVPIANHAFSFETGYVSVSGSFAGLKASGTLQYHLAAVPGQRACNSAVLTWTATTDVTAPRIPILGRALVLTPERVVPARIRCPREETNGCNGDLRLETAGGVRLGMIRFPRIPAGKRRALGIPLTSRGYRVAAGRTLRARVLAHARDRFGNEGTTTRMFTLKAGLPDLVVATFTPDKREGEPCHVGEVHHVRWSVTIRNRGPGLGPSVVTARLGSRLVTQRLTHRLAAGRAFTLDALVSGGTRVSVDPRKRVEENTETNNVRRAPPPKTLICV